MHLLCVGLFWWYFQDSFSLPQSLATIGTEISLAEMLEWREEREERKKSIYFWSSLKKVKEEFWSNMQ